MEDFLTYDQKAWILEILDLPHSSISSSDICAVTSGCGFDSYPGKAFVSVQIKLGIKMGKENMLDRLRIDAPTL